MKILVTTIDEEGKPQTQEISSKKEIKIDIDPQSKVRVGPGRNNGFLGPECLIQMFSNGPGGQIVGIRIIPEPGRDDLKYIKDVVN